MHSLGLTAETIKQKFAEIVAFAEIDESLDTPVKRYSSGMSIFEALYLGTKLHDINAQPNIFHRSFVTKWSNPPGDFSLDLYVLYMAYYHGYTVVRFLVPFLKRQHGNSKWNTGFSSKWKFIKRTIIFSVELKKVSPNNATYTKCIITSTNLLSLYYPAGYIGDSSVIGKLMA